MTPALMTRFAIKYRHRMSRMGVTQYLAQRSHAAFDTGGALYRMQTANQIQRVNNNKMKSHESMGSPGAASWFI